MPGDSTITAASGERYKSILGLCRRIGNNRRSNGEDGDLIVDLFSGELRQRTRQQSEWSVETVAESEPRAGWPGMNECVATFLNAVVGEPLTETESSNAEVGRVREALGAGPLPADAPSVAQLHMIGLAAETSKDNGGWAEIEEIDAL